MERNESFTWTGMNANGVHFTEGMKQSIAWQSDESLTHPAMYEVFILNDEFTPMDFVIQLMEQLFHKSHDDAIRLMLHIHRDGEGECGVFTRDVAETKMMQVINLARESLHPLKCVIRKSA